MKYLAKCQFCKKPLVIELSGQGYTDEEIALGLEQTSQLADQICCNACGDLRVNQRRAFEPIVKLAMYAALLQGSPTDWNNEQTEVRERMARLLREFVAISARSLKKPEIEIEDSIVQAILDKPKEVRPVLGRLWRMMRDQKDPAPELNYEPSN